MTTKTINTYIASGYSLSSAFSRLVITTTGGIGGTGLYAGSYARIFNNGVVHGVGASDGIDLRSGGFIQNGDTTVTGALIEGAGDGVVVYNGAGYVTNFATIVGEAAGVSLRDGGSVTNGAGDDTAALIKGRYAGVSVGGVGSVTNFATITGTSGGGVYLDTGSVTNGASDDTTALIEGSIRGVSVNQGIGSVTNYGTIDGGAYGVILNHGGKITNGSSADRMAVISGGTGLYLTGYDAYSTIVNSGTIVGNGGKYHYGVLGFGTTLTNGSKNNAAALIEGYGGLELGGKTNIVNFGTISATGGGAYVFGVHMRGGGSLTNGAAGHQSALIEGIIGVDVHGTLAATVTNFGTIEGTRYSVRFTSANNVLVVEAGCEFDGSIDGGAGTLVLASGVGTLTGLLVGGAVTVSGSMATTTFSDFATVEIGSCATFASSGSVTIAAGQTVIDDGSLTLGSSKNAVTNAGLIEADGAGVLIIKGAVNNTGTLAVAGGTIIVNRAVTGGGVATIHGGTLDLAASFTENVTFTGKTGILELGKSQGYTGTVTSFSKSGRTSFDLLDIDFGGGTTATYTGTKSGGVLTVTDGTHTAQINLKGDYRTSTFVTASDGHGGTFVHDPAGFIAAMAGFGAGGSALSYPALEPWRGSRPDFSAPRAHLA